MKPVVVIALIVLGSLSGAIIGSFFMAGPSAENTKRPETIGPDRREIDEKTRDYAKLWLAEHMPMETSAVDRADDDALYERLQNHEDEVANLAASRSRIEHAVSLAERIAVTPLNPVESAVQDLTIQMLQPYPLGRALLKSTDLDVQKQGIDVLSRAARDGHPEALGELARLLDALEPELARSALSALARITDRDNAPKADSYEQAGITSRLVSMLPLKDGNEERQIANVLTTLKHPVASTYWRDRFNQPVDSADRGATRRRTEAALNLQSLGSTVESQSLLNEAAVGLSAVEETDVRRAATILGALATPEAKKLIEDAIARDPEGPHVRTLRRTLREIEGGEGPGGGGRRR